MGGDAAAAADSLSSSDASLNKKPVWSHSSLSEDSGSNWVQLVPTGSNWVQLVQLVSAPAPLLL